MNYCANKAATILFMAAVLTASTGAQCNRRDVGGYTTYGPRVLTQNPSLGDVMKVVNDNSAKIRSLYTTDATLTVTGAPSLRANLAVERQKKLRLRAETALTGPELDLGSNDDLFWFWVKRNPPPTIYYCRHTQYAQSAAKQVLPIEPEWLFDALGLAWFDPNLQHSPPMRNAQGRLEITTTMPGTNGNKSKKTVIDEARGWVVEQHLFDERGTLIASAMTNRHTMDPASGAVVPQEIVVNSPAQQFQMKLDVKQWTVNQLAADPTQLFAMPSVPGWNTVDLAGPQMQMGGQAAQGAPPAMNGGGLTPLNSQPAAWGVAGPAPAAGGNYAPTSYGAPSGVMGPMFSPPASSNAGSGAPLANSPVPTPVPGLTPIAPGSPSSVRY